MDEIQERRRLPAPGARNIGIAAARDRIWVGSVERECIFAMNPADWTPVTEAAVVRPAGRAMIHAIRWASAAPRSSPAA